MLGDKHYFYRKKEYIMLLFLMFGGIEMKTFDRKFYLSKELNDDLKNRLAHIDNGISNDILIPKDKHFDVSYNRDVVKKINRFISFLKTSSIDEIKNYFKLSKSIISLADYNNLYSYSPEGSYFSLIFYENKGLLKDNDYKLLYLLPKNDYDLKSFNIKADINNVIEYKKEYILNDKQKQIVAYRGYNVVLGAAGTGKTDVAIHAYINEAPLDNIKNFGIKDNVFITYSQRLASHVDYEIDLFWNDYKNNIKKNVFTNELFMQEVLLESNIEIPGYKIINGKYINDKGIELKISNINDFKDWYNNDCINLNKSYLPKFKDIVNKYGIDYPYLFLRGIYKGKIINKASDIEIYDFFKNNHNIYDDIDIIKDLLDDYLNDLDDYPNLESFQAWYKIAIKRYNNNFKKLPNRYNNLDELYNLVYSYFDFANPIRSNKKYLDYFELFKREATLIEGYRGNVRDDFKDEIEIIFEVCKSYSEYLNMNNKLDDNDLAYYISINLDKIKSTGIFKNIIVDEFQDMTERQVHTIVSLSYDENENGEVHIYGDFEQTINPTFLQLENIETIYLVNNIDNYEKQILSSSYRYSNAICKELEALREKGVSLFGLEDKKYYVPLISNSSKEFQASGNLVLDINVGNKMLDVISKSKNDINIMFICANDESKLELINKYKIDKEKIFTINESKGREEDFVVVYKLCSSKGKEYENIFSNDLSYSRAERIFYNQLYVGITRCKINFLQIEDEKLLGKNTTINLKNLIKPLREENVDLFLEELLSNKANFYFRARDSFKNLDFDAAKENLSFYSKEDYDDLIKKLVINYMKELIIINH